MHPSTLLLAGGLALPVLLTQCGGHVCAPPDYTPIGDGLKFTGVCVVVAMLVATLGSLVSHPPAADEAEDD